MPLRQDLACIFIEVTWAKEGLLKHFPSSNASAAVTSLEKTTLRVRRHEAPLPLVDLQPSAGTSSDSICLPCPSRRNMQYESASAPLNHV